MDRLEQVPEAAKRGLSYPAYLELMAGQAGAPTGDLAPEDARKVEFTRLNLHRSRRIGRTWRPREDLVRLVDRIAFSQVWMVLTEPWCGDSAQCLPVIAAVADRNPAVDLRLVLRDANPDIMDRFLTGGKRSIPRLVIFSGEGAALAQWGPRPAAAQTVFEGARAAGLDKDRVIEKLHLWYGRDRGRTLEEELAGLLRGILPR